MLFILVIELNF